MISVTCVIANDSYSQTARVSLDMKNIAVKDVLNEIEQTSEFYFLYSSKLVDVERKVNIYADNQPIKDILEGLFASSNVDYVVIDRQIVLSPGEFISKAKTRLQPMTVTGQITDENGEPLPGVAVMVKGTTRGTLTDAEGEYTIEVEDQAAVIVFSFVGYSTQEVTVGTRTEINISMELEYYGLEDIVVVGYGSVKKSDLTGSVSSVKTTDILEMPISSIDQGLIGRVAGVRVTQTNGLPGAPASIRIRGSSSLQGGNEPLYVIDGFPVYGGGDKISVLATINPNDIESIEVLKDASSTAIYGSRASNGVVLITTKSGVKGKDNITFNSSFGVASLVRKIDMLEPLEYAELINTARINDGLEVFYDETQMAEIRNMGKGTDWQEELFRNAQVQDYNLNFSGGDDKTVYSITGSYLNQEGIIVNSGYKRYSGRINLQRNITDNFNVGTHFTTTQSYANFTNTGTAGYGSLTYASLRMNPIQPVYEDEEKGIYTQRNEPGVEISNPVAAAKEMVDERSIRRILGDIYADWEIIRNLNVKVKFGVDLNNMKDDDYTPTNIYEGRDRNFASISSSESVNWLNENTITWNKNINDNHSFLVLGGIIFQQNIAENVYASSEEFVTDLLKENNLQSATLYNQPSSGRTEWALNSYIGRINYNLMDKYLLTINSRIDGSSRFGGNNKYGFFPSGAFAWRLINEDFIRNLGIFSDLKLRLGYGVTGNQEIGLYQSLPTLSSASYAIGGGLVTGIYPNKIPNPDLKWEKTSELNIGGDLGFFNNRLVVTTDYYNKKTIDLIYDSSIPYVSGFSTSLQNVGSIKNTGLEISLESYNLVGEFKWQSSFNIAFYRNEVLELGGEEYKDVGSGDGHLKTGNPHRLIVGEPVAVFYGFVFDGIYQNQAEIDAGPIGPTTWIGGRRYKDISGPDGVPDGSVDATYDRTIIGNPHPDFYGGFLNSFSYKGFELNVFMEYSYGNDIFNYNDIDLELPTGNQNVYEEMKNYWTPENPGDIYPKPTTNRSQVFSSRQIEDGSYLKIKTLTLSYRFPNLRSNIGFIENLNLFVTVQNYFTFTNYRGYDPDISYRGITNLEIGEDYTQYPQTKSIVLGIQLGF